MNCLGMPLHPEPLAFPDLLVPSCFGALASDCYLYFFCGTEMMMSYYCPAISVLNALSLATYLHTTFLIHNEYLTHSWPSPIEIFTFIHGGAFFKPFQATMLYNSKHKLSILYFVLMVSNEHRYCSGNF